MAQTRHPELTRSQVKATLISMRNRAIQSNTHFVIPNDDEIDLEFASVETPNSPHHDTFHSNPDEELYKDVVFNEDGTTIVDTPMLPSV